MDSLRLPALAPVLALAATALAGCTLVERLTAEPIELAAAEYELFNPWLGPDGQRPPGVQRERSELARAEAILADHGIFRIGDIAAPDADSCLDAGTADVDLVLADGERWEVPIGGCEDQGSFLADLHALVVEWGGATAG